ncbi:MAG: TonB-dependent receptor [Myxococcota bacterium]
MISVDGGPYGCWEDEMDTPDGDLPHEHDVEEVVVIGEKPITAASSLTADADDLRVRPLPRPGDLAEVMPGLFAVQHAGGGKANQYFVRGFDADHGTDIALAVDGVPVNLVSHGHGQGYADLHFVIPELVVGVDVRKGPYEVFDGDFATAGAVDMHLVDRVPESYATASVGRFGTARGLGVFGLESGASSAVLAAEVYATDGPFENPEGLSRYNAYGKFTATLSDAARVSVGGSAYASGWTASGQIPLRAVEAGQLSRFGTVDPTEGGQSTRRQLWVDATVTPGHRELLTASAWVGAYRLNMYSNFTFFAKDPVNGDQIEQQDERVFSGFDAAYRIHHHLGPLTFATRLGTQGRADRIATGLWHDDDRERLSTTVDADIEEVRIGAYVREEIGFDDVVRVIGGVRTDTFTFGVDDGLDLPGDGVRSSGVADAQVLSPKANLIVTPLRQLDLFVNYGRGFHSNDARGVVRSDGPVDPITQATGYEAGVRLRDGRAGESGRARHETSGT